MKSLLILKDDITKIIIEKNILKIVDEELSRCIEICTLFYSFFSLPKTPYGEMNDEKLNN